MKQIKRILKAVGKTIIILLFTAVYFYGLSKLSDLVTPTIGLSVCIALLVAATFILAYKTTK